MPKSPNNPKKTFVYHAKTTKGKMTQGQIDADNILIAKSLLKKQGLHDIRLKPKSKLNLTRFGLSAKVDTLSLSVFYRHLTTLLSAGIALTQCLHIAGQNCQNATLKHAINAIKTDVQAGMTLAKAFGRHPKIFDRLSIALIDAGEESGQLETMLERLNRHHERTWQLKNKLAKVAKYPIAVLLTAIVVSAVMLTQVVPSLAQMFVSMDKELPLPTQIVMAMSDFVVGYFWVLVVAMVSVLAVMGWLWRHSPKFHAHLATLSLRLPVLRSLTTKTANARFARTLATTFWAGTPLLTALQLAGKSTNHQTFIQATNVMAQHIHSGSKLHDAMSLSGLFTPMTLHMVQVGEESGKLTQMLERVADHHEQELSIQIDSLTGLIEPTVIIILGVLVGSLVVAMYLPLIQIGA